MKLIKNAFVYVADLPSLSELDEALDKKPYAPLGATQLRRTSFVENPTTKERVTPIDGGYAFSYRMDEKILPAAVVNEALNERVSKIEEEEGRPVGFKERSVLKNDVLLELLPKAMSKHTLIDAFYHVERQILVINTASGTVADTLVSDLLDALGRFKYRKLQIVDLDLRLTTRLTAYVDHEDDEAFGPLDPGRYVQLKDSNGNKTTFDTVNSPEKGILEAISSGAQVERMSFLVRGTEFKLTRTFDFKSLSFAPTDAEESDDWDEDVAGLWRAIAGAQLEVFVRVVLMLADLFAVSGDDALLSLDQED